jgi:hypothetical protein
MTTFNGNKQPNRKDSNWRHYQRQASLGLNVQRLFIILLFGVAGVLIFLNLRPYIEVAQMIVPQLARLDILSLLTRIPLLGILFDWVFSVVGTFTASIIGITVWGLIQTAQVAPLIWRADLNILNSSIQGVGQHRYFETTEEDSEALAKLKEMHNQAPTRFVKFWESASRANAYLS